MLLQNMYSFIAPVRDASKEAIALIEHEEQACLSLACLCRRQTMPFRAADERKAFCCVTCHSFFARTSPAIDCFDGRLFSCRDSTLLDPLQNLHNRSERAERKSLAMHANVVELGEIVKTPEIVDRKLPHFL